MLMATRYAAGIPAGEPRRRAARASRCRIRTGIWRPSCRRGGAVVADLLEPDGGVREQDQVVVAEDDLDLGADGSSRSVPV